MRSPAGEHDALRPIGERLPYCVGGVMRKREIARIKPDAGG
jgi:hypothetical protein